MSKREMWQCRVCTLSNPSNAPLCAACNRPRGRLRSRATPEASVTLERDRAYAVTEEIVVQYVNPHRNSFDVISIIPWRAALSDKTWPIPGVTEQHWRYIGGDSSNRAWGGGLTKELLNGSVRFARSSFEPGTYQVQLRYFINGSWSNVQTRCRLDLTGSRAEAKTLPRPSSLCIPSLVPDKPKADGCHFPAKVKHRALVGLQNIGNTCYMNAAVQCLATLTPIMQAFLPRIPGPDPPPSSGMRLLGKKQSFSPGFSLPLESPRSAKTKKHPKEERIMLENGEWQCSKCTLRNSKDDIRCKICGKLAGRDVREQKRKENQPDQIPKVFLGKESNQYKLSEDIVVKFKDPAAKPYTVICIVPCQVWQTSEAFEGLWPVPNCNRPGIDWVYTDGTPSRGLNGQSEGEVSFSADKLGGGKYQAQLRYYIDGNWTKIQATFPLSIEGPPRRSSAEEPKTPPASRHSKNGGSKSPIRPASLHIDKDNTIGNTPDPSPKMLRSPRRRALKPGVLSNEFTRLVHTLNDFDIDGKYICPEYLKYLIEYIRPEFKGSRQHDCQEFTQALLDELNRDLRRADRPKRKKRRSGIVVRKNRKRKPMVSNSELPSTRARIMMETLRRPNGSVISEMCFGMLENRIECLSCHNESTVYSSFSTVSLDIITIPRSPLTRNLKGSRKRSKIGVECRD
ncbi:hypothetical protein AAMO2058_001528800, partial [Amorphochlora amoebiformis]